MNKKSILNILSMALGSVYLISGFTKILDINGFTNIMTSYGSKLRFLVPLITGTEICIGFLLLFLIQPRVVAKFSFFMLLTFTLAYVYGYFKMGIEDCGCFGDLIKMSPLETIIRNVILLGISVIIFLKYPKVWFHSSFWYKSKIALSFTSGLLICILTGFTVRNSLNDLESYLHQTVKDTNLNVNSLPDKTILIYIYSPSCPHCQESVPLVNKFKTTGKVDSIIAFTSDKSTNEEILKFEKDYCPSFKTIRKPSENLKKITRSIPVALVVKNDTINEVYSSKYFHENH